MVESQPRYTKEEFARRGDEWYARAHRPRVGPEDEGKFVAIDIVSGIYEIDADELAASDRLLARQPSAQVWLTRIGYGYARRIGARRPRARRSSASSHAHDADPITVTGAPLPGAVAQPLAIMR